MHKQHAHDSKLSAHERSKHAKKAATHAQLAHEAHHRHRKGEIKNMKKKNKEHNSGSSSGSGSEGEDNDGGSSSSTRGGSNVLKAAGKGLFVAIKGTANAAVGAGKATVRLGQEAESQGVALAQAVSGPVTNLPAAAVASTRGAIANLSIRQAYEPVWIHVCGGQVGVRAKQKVDAGW